MESKNTFYKFFHRRQYLKTFTDEIIGTSLFREFLREKGRKVFGEYTIHVACGNRRLGGGRGRCIIQL